MKIFHKEYINTIEVLFCKDKEKILLIEKDIAIETKLICDFNSLQKFITMSFYPLYILMFRVDNELKSNGLKEDYVNYIKENNNSENEQKTENAIRKYKK
eukprot:GAHX01002403.1.p1 GENE.GAHX01002403.1~~GAHX01002403.1.p1  ORF type:complete len:100 (+),score=24.18 GAHX01002403.1:586-885(+)